MVVRRRGIAGLRMVLGHDKSPYLVPAESHGFLKRLVNQVLRALHGRDAPLPVAVRAFLRYGFRRELVAAARAFEGEVCHATLGAS